MLTRKKLIAIMVISFLAIKASAVAVLPTVNPANVMNTLDQNLPWLGAPGQTNFTVAPVSQPTESTGKESEQSKFVLRQIDILGATHPVPQNVQDIYKSDIGKEVSFEDVQNLVASMEQIYRNDGYILVQVVLPPQEIDVDKGVLQLQIIEGQIQNVIFEGDNPGAAKTQLERYAEAIENEDPVKYQTIDRFLILANQIPGIDVSATLVPNKEVTGGADLVVDVKHSKYSAFINANNRGTQYIGPGQLAAGIAVYDVFGADAISLTGATSTSNPQQLKYSSWSYDLVVGPYGTEINPNISITQTAPGGALSAFDMYGESEKYTLDVYQPVYTSTPQSVTLHGSFYHLNSFNSIFDSTQLYNDNDTALLLGAEYQGVFWQTYNDITASTTFGIPILGTAATLPNPSVANGQTKFVKFDLLTSQIHYLTQHVSVAVGTQIQMTPEPLLSSEQIGYGGQVFGQAFIPYVISGDNGIMGSVALRYDLPSVWAFSQLQPEVFYDAGKVSSNEVASGTANGSSAESAGVGINMQFTDHWQGSFVFAKPLRITQTTGVNMGWEGFFNLTGVL